MQIYIKVGDKFIASYHASSFPRVGEIIEYNHFEEEKNGCYEVESVRHHMNSDGEDVYYEVVLDCIKIKKEV